VTGTGSEFHVDGSTTTETVYMFTLYLLTVYLLACTYWSVCAVGCILQKTAQCSRMASVPVLTDRLWVADATYASFISDRWRSILQ